ncbi:hypothetical protein NEF87_001923 [Candidatus Lokiarchaeum ossiferum]|uniref:LVIVD repeat protein n=1 Tax=Candidatus Lokiarchaeum ossiferum TaxID=2951803 RepID=A0ABY6HQ47_9ARCH|nr:hypothetical protein NEF87_001923 [Candidatus Lokiarchaeum sp. B-35]
MELKHKKILIGILIGALIGSASILTISLLNSQGKIGSFTEIGQIDTNGETMNVQIRDNIAYVIDTQDDNPGGLMLIDISDPESPELLGSYIDGGMIWDFELQGDLAYLANRYDGLEIVNISNPSSIHRIGHYRPGHEIYDVAVQGDLAYVAAWELGFEILNISNPTTPTRISRQSLTGTCINVFLEGDVLYVTDHLNTYTNIEAYNVSISTTPAKLGEFMLEAHDFFFPIVHGDYLYVADHGSTGDLVILNISDPTSIAEIGRFKARSESYPNRMCFKDNILYMSEYEKGLVLIDVTDPTEPTILNTYFNGGAGYGVAVAGDYIYFAARHGGLQILQYTP